MMKRATWATVLAVVGGCGSSTPPPNNPSNLSRVDPMTVDAGASMLSNEPDAGVTAVTPTEPAPPAAPVRIVAGERRAVPAPGPHVTITAPRNGSTVREDRVEVRLNVLHWRNVADANDHRHIHLVLDNEAYRRVDDPSQPVVLEHLSPGTHVLRAFPGWETHETVKEAGAFAMVVFHVGAAAQNFSFNPRAPLLTYSRPKGAVNGADASRVLLDFYLTNIPANGVGPQGFRVRPTVDGHAMDELTAWVPYYIENLPDGPHTIALQLLDAHGQPAPGMFNEPEQHITVSHAAAAETHGDHHPAPAPAAANAPLHTTNSTVNSAPVAPGEPGIVSPGGDPSAAPASSTTSAAPAESTTAPVTGH